MTNAIGFRVPSGIKLFASAAACLVASSAGAFAISATEKAIDLHMPAGTTVRTGTPDQVDSAAKATISDPSVKTSITDSSIVSLAVVYAPRLAPDIAQFALADISGDLTLSAGNRDAQAASIVRNSMNAVLVGSRTRFPGGVVNKSDGAAAVTAAAVTAVLNSSFHDLLGIVVTNAVKTAQNRGGTGLQNGAAGAVTGAISQTAGVSNGDIANGGDDTTVISVITAAAKAAPSRISDIADAVGYAFAGTYLKTTNSGQESATTFRDTNVAGLVAAIEAGLTRGQIAKYDTIIRNQVTSGIALAYTGFVGPGEAGVNNFAYNNGNGQAVTNVQGL